MNSFSLSLIADKSGFGSVMINPIDPALVKVNNKHHVVSEH